MIKTIAISAMFCILLLARSVLAEEQPPTWIPTPEERANAPWIPTGDEVLIGNTGISMPLGRILVIKKGGEYCAIKFTNTWLGKTQYDHYTSYEFYYQGDGSGDFSKSNIESGKGDFFFPRVQSFFGFWYQTGSETILKCGKLKVEWFYITTIRFDKTELAPTPWTLIEEVNVHDPRIQWYKKEEERKQRSVPINRLLGASPGR